MEARSARGLSSRTAEYRIDETRQAIPQHGLSGTRDRLRHRGQFCGLNEITRTALGFLASSNTHDY